MINTNSNNSIENEIDIKIKNEPNFAGHYWTRALLSMSAGRTTEAESDIEKLIEMANSKEDAELLSNLSMFAMFLLQEKEYKSKAINIFTKAISIDPNNPEYYKHRASCFSRNESDNAEADYDKAIELEPSNSEHFLDRADFLTGLGISKRNDDALADYDKAVQLNTMNGIPYFKRAQFFEKQKKYKEAIFDYSNRPPA